jgi:hypothetical protein
VTTLPKAFPNSTTEVAPEKSVATIEAYLVRLGADQILKEYGDLDGQRVLMSISFLIKPKDGPTLPFRLPADTDLTLQAMKRWKGTPFARLTKLQANRVAWRNVVEWVRSQCVFIMTGGGSLEQVFLPYLLVGDKTLYQRTAMLPHGVGGIAHRLNLPGAEP